MKRNSLLCLMLLLCVAPLAAQQPSATDRVTVMGAVVDHLTNEPQPYCLLQFIHGTDTVAVRCDEEGFFVSDRMSVGAYTLTAILKGKQVYRADLVLNDNAALHIAVITDTFTLRNLQTVDVKAIRRHPGTLLITSNDDTRMWNLSGQMDYDDRSASKDLSGNPNNFGLLTHPGLEVHPLGSNMKNELLLYGRILDTKRVAPADTTKGKN